MVYRKICFQIFIVYLFVLNTQAYLQYCPPSYFYDIQHCEKCQTNCICKTQNSCDSCIEGYTLYKKGCIQCPQATGIYGACSGCCSKETGTVLACTDCMAVPGKYSFLFAGRCILSDGCFEVDSNGFCTQCRNSYYQVDNLCYPCDTSCSTCSDSSNCINCADGYYWKVNHGGFCTQCPNGCATCNQQGICNSCLVSYYLYTDHCLNCPLYCFTCVDGSSCTSCSQGILVSNLCIKCDDTIYGGSAGCLSCIQNNNFIKCQQCDDTYFLDSSTGVCRRCSTYIAGAVRCRDQNTPTQCQDDMDAVLQNRYYLVGISCIQNTKKCKKIVDMQGNCATCYDGYLLAVTMDCQLCPFTGCKLSNRLVINNVCTCTECDVGNYLPSGSALCSVCSTANCAICAGNVCSKCMTDYYLSGSTCNPQVISNCLYLSSSSACQTCKNEFYLGSNNLCYSCQTNCKKCTSRFICSACSDGFYLHSSQVCVKIPDNCYEFDSSKGECILCKHGFYLQYGFCQKCNVQTGTLNQCQGLCPIDYYIKELLNIKMGFQFYTSFSLCFVLLIIMFWL